MGDKYRGPPKFKLKEIKKHKHPGNLWIVMGENVYDVSSFEHPGTVMSLLENSDGKDAIKEFE